MAPSSEASRVGFHFPGDFLFFLLSLHICSSGPGSGTLKVKFSGRLFGFSCKFVVNFRFCRIWLKPRPICSSAHCFLNFLQGSFHHYDKDDENDKDTIVYNADTDIVILRCSQVKASTIHLILTSPHWHWPPYRR